MGSQDLNNPSKNRCVVFVERHMTRCDQAESPSASHVDLHDTDLHPALVGRWDVDLAPSDHTMGHFSNHVRSEKKRCSGACRLRIQNVRPASEAYSAPLLEPRYFVQCPLAQRVIASGTTHVDRPSEGKAKGLSLLMCRGSHYVVLGSIFLCCKKGVFGTGNLNI